MSKDWNPTQKEKWHLRTQRKLTIVWLAIESNRYWRFQMRSILFDGSKSNKICVECGQSRAHRNKYAFHRTISNYHVKRNNIVGCVKCVLKKNCTFVTFHSGVDGDMAVVKHILWAFDLCQSINARYTLPRHKSQIKTNIVMWFRSKWQFFEIKLCVKVAIR